MKQEPYVGVTGFMSNDEVSAVLAEVDRVSPDSERKLMVGVLMGTKTAQGLPNKWPNRYPKSREAKDIFVPHPRSLGLVHYHADDPQKLYEEILWADAVCGMAKHNQAFSGFQLNVCWPDPLTLMHLRAIEHQLGERSMIIVLQIGGGAFDKIHHSPGRLAEKIHDEYLDLIDYVLLDPSGGKGEPFNPQKALEYLRALRADNGINQTIGLGVAGGLSAQNIGLLKPILEEFPDISFDAEGQLRDSADHLDMQKTLAYVRAAFELCDQVLA